MEDRQMTIKDVLRFLDACAYDEHPETGHLNIEAWADVFKNKIKECRLDDELKGMGYRKVKEIKLGDYGDAVKGNCKKTCRLTISDTIYIEDKTKGAK